MKYTLTLTDEDGIVLRDWLCCFEADPDDDSDVSLPLRLMGPSMLCGEINNEIEVDQKRRK